MCGIVGMAGLIELKHRDAFKDLLTICQLRGRDSTGVFKVTQNNGVAYQKKVGLPENILDSKFYDTHINNVDTKIMVGHCRAKTAGLVTPENAHPFDFPNVIGVHNGTLSGVYNMPDQKDFDVDSEVLYNLINKVGIQEAFNEVDKDGAWTLVFFDKKENTINFLRNEKRPLYLTWSKDLKTMFWASEAWWFAAVERRGIELWAGDEKNPKFWELPVNALYSFEASNHRLADKPTLNLKPIRVIEAKKEVRGYAGNYRGALTTYNRPNSGGGSVVRPFPQTAYEELDDNLDDMVGLLQGLPPRINTKTPEDAPTTPIMLPKPSTTSKNISDFRPPSMRQPSGERKNVSVPLVNSKVSLPDSRKSNSGESKKPILSLVPASKSKVSFREVLGMEYITDNKTKNEYSLKEFDEATNSTCCFCKKGIGDLKEVHEFIDPKKFVCVTCVSAFGEVK